jgi:hypothetical protein
MNPFFKSVSFYSIKLGVILVIVVLTLTVIPGASSLWYERLHVDVNVSTGDWSHPRSKGYWCHALANSIGHHSHQFPSLSELEDYFDEISSNSYVFNFTGTGLENVMEAMDILGCHYSGSHPWQHNSMEYKLKEQLLAVWLNVVSGYGDGYALNLGNTTVLLGGEIINISENVLVTHNTPLYESMKNICEEYNTRWE